MPIKPATFIENALFFSPLYIFGFFVKDQVSIGVWVYFWIFDSIPLIDLSFTVPIPCMFYHYCSVVQIEFRDSKYLMLSFSHLNDFAQYYLYTAHVLQ